MINSLVQILLPVFLVVGIGYMITLRAILNINEIDGILNLTQRILIPIFLFLTILNIDLSLNLDLRVLCGYYLSSILCFATGALIAKLFLNFSKAEAIVLGFAAMFSNAVLLGLPITEIAYGSNALGYNLMLVATQAPFCYLIGITAMEVVGITNTDVASTAKNILKAIFSNNITLSILLGICCNILDIIFPGVILHALNFLSEGAVAIALFGLGGVLTTFKFNKASVAIILIIFLSLIIHPFLTLLSLSSIDHSLTAASKGVILTASMAPGLNAFIFANYYKCARDTVAASILLATPISIVSTSLWIFVIDQKIV